MDKTELLEALEDGQQELLELLDDVDDEAMLEPGVCGIWSVKDILAHMTHWEGQLVTLLFQARRGADKPSTAHFGKVGEEELNQRWYEASKERPLDAVWQDWLSVRKQTIRRVGEYSTEELNDPQLFAWLKGNPLWQWICGGTLEHDDEHADQIREWLEQRDANNNGNRQDQAGHPG